MTDLLQSGSLTSDALDAWFKREVVVHEEALTRYLCRFWPNVSDIHDLRQETYARIYESARTRLPSEARPFIFTIARRLMTDRIRRQRIVAIDSVGDLDTLNVLVDEISPEREAAAHQELRKLAEALDGLPPKCREVVWMRRVEDLSQKEVAARLGLSEKSVEKHVMKGMRRLIDVVLGVVSTDEIHESAFAATAHMGNGRRVSVAPGASENTGPDQDKS